MARQAAGSCVVGRVCVLVAAGCCSLLVVSCWLLYLLQLVVILWQEIYLQGGFLPQFPCHWKFHVQ